MNLKNIISKQLILDKAIVQAHNIKDKEWVNKAILALYTEIGELANEIQCFKYWKKNIVKNDLLIQEEYADGMHFLISFVIELGAKDIIEEKIVSDDVNHQFIEMFKSISNFQINYNSKTIEECVSLYLGIAKLINMTEDDINESYNRKNKINFERIKNNY